MEYYVVPKADHRALVSSAFRARGYASDEVEATTRLCEDAAGHGIHTHNAIKALHLDELFGSRTGGCVPGATIEVLPCRFPAAQIWDCHRKIGPAVAYRAMEVCLDLAASHGVGMVSVDNAFHYFWGGGYVLEAARAGYIGYTQCTATLAEVVPHGGKAPTLGTNPHSWAFPTQDILGYPILVDWATSAVAMGRVQQLKREGGQLPPQAAVDAEGRPTTDPTAAIALLPFGAHKGYGLGLINEVMAALIGGWIPSVRGKPNRTGEKNSTCFFFQAIHPEALQAGNQFQGDARSNLAQVLQDIRNHGNQAALFPGQIEAQWASRSAEHNGLFFTAAEIEGLKRIAETCGARPLDSQALKRVSF